MKSNSCDMKNSFDESIFGLHPPVLDCPGNCSICPEQTKSSASMRRLQIDINLTCDLRCHNCDRHLDIAPGNKEQDLSIDQLKRMLDESVSLNYTWEAFLLLGGEPTLHPQFREIVDTIVRYRKDHNPKLKVRMASNGYSKKAKEELDWVAKTYPFIIIVNTSKTSPIQEDFVNVRLAPKDRYLNYSNFERCMIPCYSGLGFNYSGFYGCATGGATARVFGYDIGIKSLKELTYSRLEQFYKTICPLCGHWDAAELLASDQSTLMSKSWESAVTSFSKRKSDPLTRY